MTKLALLLAALVAACTLAGTARADGDPASDYLLGTQVFLPIDAKIPVDKQKEITDVLAAANRAGYKIRVAVIWSAYDLGAITSLWRKPRTYARFLGTELQFVYAHRLLIVMPNGFGFYWFKHPSAREYAVIDKIPIENTPVGLVDAAEKAVVALAQASNVKIGTDVAAGPSNNHKRVIIILAAIALVALAVLLRLALRKRV
jgi:hypothetical protein